VRCGALTGLRLFAAAWVVLFHFEFTKGELLADVLAPAYPVVTTGAMGVDLFYVLSGFVIAFIYLARLGPRWRWRPRGGSWWPGCARAVGCAASPPASRGVPRPGERLAQGAGWEEG
jgi:peptidoglycan/LPS O-acetylase OafA/YrhL